MKISSYLRKKRNEAEISDSFFAEQVGINISWVDDLESYEDELDGLSIPTVKKICNLLNITLFDMFNVAVLGLETLTFSEIVKKRRQEKELSVEELSELIGYNITVIETIENDGKLDGVCWHALKKIACELDLPMEILLKKL